MLTRLALLYNNYETGNIANHSSDLTRMWLVGLRYDLRVTAIALGVILLSATIMAVNQFTWRAWIILSRVYLLITTIFIVSASIGSYYYFQTFHQPFNIFLFALFEDDTKTVLSNIWDDYPVIKLVLLTMLSGFLTIYLFTKLQKRNKQPGSTSIFICYLIISIFLFTLLGRGSFGTFPLRRANAQVSESATINHITPNAVMALSWAWKDKKNDIKLESYSDEEIAQALEILGLDTIYETSRKNSYLEQNPPHVVLTLMESFGSNMLAFDDPVKNDMLGSLRQHFQEDFVFKRFLPHGNGTAPSLAALFFNSPLQNISHSSLSHLELETPFSTYRNAGYKTVFISPGNLMWRNLANYLPTQQVDQVYDQNSLLNEYPEAARHLTDWGLPDEYAFRYAHKILMQAQEPMFIGILTVTNHPPYRYPDTYQPKPVSMNTGYEQHAEEGKIDHSNLLTTFQYAADAYGSFISTIKDSTLADKTILAATGDHQMRRIKAFYPQEAFLDRAVPFYLYVPEKIQSNIKITYEPSRTGSHKDIMPTLYEASLSDTRYLALAGRNMLAPFDIPEKNFGYNELLWINEDGAFNIQGKTSLHRWDGSNSGIVTNDPNEPSYPVNIKHKHESYNKIMRSLLQSYVSSK